jgi:hypothetical protein
MSPSCPSPLGLRRLLDYWFGEAGPAEDDQVERHLLACDACGDHLRELLWLGDSVARAARAGAVELIVTPAFLEAAAREGLRTREYGVDPGGTVLCTVTAQDDLLVARLRADFRGVGRLDLVANEEGSPVRRIEDVPIDPNASELIVAQAMPMVRQLGHVVLRLRLLAREGDGERVIGEYTFSHSPSPA